MTRRITDEAKKAAKKGLEARLELLVRNVAFKQDLVKGQEMYIQYRNAPIPTYTPLYANPYLSLDVRRQSYQESMEKSPSFEEYTKQQEIRTKERQLKSKYDHYLAKWDLKWGPWEYVDTKNVDFPSLSPRELKTLFKQASTEGDLMWGKSGPPHIFRLPVIASDPVALERDRVSEELGPAGYDPEDGEPYVWSEEELDDFVPGQVGKKLNLELNLTFPRDVLEELVRLNLERVFKSGKEPKKRQHLSKIKDQLRVFDLHKKGLTFPLIRTQFPLPRPPLSTVKSDYVSICRKINSINSSPSGSAEPLFNIETHMTKCPQCKNATDVKQFCEAAQQYINQDYKSAPSQTSSRDDWDSFNP